MDQSIVSQREIHVDTESYVTTLRASLRQSPDVILLGEMRDYETMQVAMTAAETGHLIFSTLHTIGAASTIVCRVDVFPPNQQHQIAVQLSMVLQAVISQQLVPSIDEKMIPVGCARSSPVRAGFGNYAHHGHTKKGPPDLFVVCLATKK